MTIPSDYIVDLTSGSKSASHEYDFFESELFSFDQQIKKNYSETKCDSTTLINENSHSLNFKMCSLMKKEKKIPRNLNFQLLKKNNLCQVHSNHTFSQ